MSIKYRLFKTYCMPHYGSVLWDLSHQGVEYFCTQWRKCIRKLFNLPYTTHCNLLSSICQDIPIEFQLMSRVMKFLVKVGNSENKVLQLCYKFALNGSMSKISNTVNHVSCLLKISKHLLLQSSVGQKLIRFGIQIPENVMGKADHICNLLLLRENSVISLFTYEELTSMIDYLCTD